MSASPGLGTCIPVWVCSPVLTAPREQLLGLMVCGDFPPESEQRSGRQKQCLSPTPIHTGDPGIPIAPYIYSIQAPSERCGDCLYTCHLYPTCLWAPEGWDYSLFFVSRGQHSIWCMTGA